MCEDRNTHCQRCKQALQDIGLKISRGKRNEDTAIFNHDEGVGNEVNTIGRV